MLLPENIHPENTLIYNGAIIVQALKVINRATLLDLFVAAQMHKKMSMPLFALSLDWLYLANCIEVNQQGEIVLCS